MDLEEIGNKISNLTFYDLKSFYTQAKNYALNISEIEAKVRDATNDDPWGASSTLMQEIAQAHDFNEIMPTIFNRFMEKDASEWRQIYKSLQLLEYIVKNGSERVVDEARLHLSTIKILRTFHYIDEHGKDQGINIRNRAKELATLLSDIDTIRVERRRARANRDKYRGTGNADFVPGSGGGRYSGFSSESYHAGAGAPGGATAYGTNTPYGAAASEYEEYDAGDDDERQAPDAAPAQPEQRTVDLFVFDDPEPAPKPAPAPPGPTPAFEFDEFDDFQTAPTHTQIVMADEKPANKPKSRNDIFEFFDKEPSPPSRSVRSVPPMQPPLASKTSAPLKPVRQAPKSSDTFGDLWETSRGKASATKGADKGKMPMAQLAKDQTSSSVWGSDASKPKSAQSEDLFDLL
ncbi:Epsin-3, clathrin recruitment and traffic between the Golgi and endosome [Malassezia vespertilionis]|uniref:Epsin-3, clathrin recruitment and traffic between the Golgi and endosome n=1 Tax=Malassezia vespertilionis TaxID=2020962 RepID=UPI0024B07139|nr:Epsin-3, clathrin recruitment and traffic between the Golgi and endosome [Malassezia vespertilionis]WFD07676.1 Epsin-3, clathrin recruitment and traffic between the Golgi and endosome [Malassezia vespertilionis]